MTSKKDKERALQHYKSELEKMFSDSDFSRYFGDGKVIKYSDLADYNNINELLPNNKDFRIILVESSVNQGHWVCIMKYNNVIEYFNSYGTKPEYDFKFIPTFVKHLLGQGGNLLTKLIKTKSGNQKVYYNKKKFQVINDSVNTCGRWVTARILAMLIGWELDDFINKVEDKMEETGKPSDILVCDWIK
ncbi:MAG: hypothetical protein EBU90_21975 [Proteobacteria bacterium]|nr:hypothetical protein [Pseudomonadota bacterium]NBP15999.1 hypothetical protein [bacterium]